MKFAIGMIVTYIRSSNRNYENERYKNNVIIGWYHECPYMSDRLNELLLSTMAPFNMEDTGNFDTDKIKNCTCFLKPIGKYIILKNHKTTYIILKEDNKIDYVREGTSIISTF